MVGSLINRRSFFGGVAAFLAAPAIIRVASLMTTSVQPPSIIPAAELTDFPVMHPELVKLWSKKIAREALRETMAHCYQGSHSSNLVRVFDKSSIVLKFNG